MYYFTGTVNLMAQIGFKLPCSRAAEPGRRAPCCITNSHMPRRENANTPASAQAQQDAVSEGIENFELPRALVTRIAKSAVRCRFSYRYNGATLLDAELAGSGQREVTEGYGSLTCQRRDSVHQLPRCVIYAVYFPHFFLIQHSQLLRTSYNITETHP